MMGDIPPGPSHHYYPTGPPFPHLSAPIPSDPQRYFAELLEERQRLAPFAGILPHCSRLLNQEISRLSGHNQGFIGYEKYEHQSPFQPLPLLHPSVRPMGFEALSTMKMQENVHLQMGLPGVPFLPTPMGLPGVPTIPVIQQSSSSRPQLRKLIRLDFPVDKYPNYNFVDRLLGTLEGFEAYTGCRLFIRGKGSLRDPIKEEQLKGDPEYEHLREPLHVVVEAEFPEDEVNARLDKAVEILARLMKPDDEYLDKVKKDRLKGLAIY